MECEPQVQHVSQPIMIHLGNSRYLTKSVYRDQEKIHIREYNESTGNRIPTKKGVTFNLKRFASFMHKMDQINDQVEKLVIGDDVDYKVHLGGGIFTTVKSGYKCVNIRKYFLPMNCSEPIPTRMGISLRLGEWDKLKEAVLELCFIEPELINVVPCYNEITHMNLLFAIECRECNPFSSINYDQEIEKLTIAG
jgi:hypothetical protein